MEFEYLLPEGAAPGGKYSLTWLRQPGMGRDSMNASVAGRNWSMEPAGRRLEVATSLGEQGLSRFLPW
ncbi:MAG TPA: hypothetical protein VG637_01365 [Actinomycetes bacterium]|nr:hypothetical protein [Actinomycetes bacterium]